MVNKKIHWPWARLNAVHCGSMIFIGIGGGTV